LTDCVVEVERRIKRNKMRLDSTNGRSDSNETPESAEAAQKLSQLQIEISNLLVEIERLGEVILHSLFYTSKLKFWNS